MRRQNLLEMSVSFQKDLCNLRRKTEQLPLHWSGSCLQKDILQPKRQGLGRYAGNQGFFSPAAKRRQMRPAARRTVRETR